MPIHCALALSPVSDTDFDSVDTLVMAASYAAHNRLGRLCDERIYENDVAARLRADGFDNVHTQLPVTVSHGLFTRTYRLDLVAGGVIYEIKKSVALALDHETQAIHYAALCDTNRAKLINFGAPKVAGRLLRTPFPEVDRRQFTLSLGRWRVLSERCDVLLERLMALLADWGAFLEASLYQEALVQLLSRPTPCERRLTVSRDGIELGTHGQSCHAPDVGFLVTALSRDTEAYERHIQRLLDCLPLRGIQWLNLKHSELQPVTLTKQ
jgi:GxxExxY protein